MNVSQEVKTCKIGQGSLAEERCIHQMSCRFKQNTLYWNSYLEDDIPRLKGCDFRNRHRLVTALAISIEPVSRSCDL